MLGLFFAAGLLLQDGMLVTYYSARRRRLLWIVGYVV